MEDRILAYLRSEPARSAPEIVKHLSAGGDPVLKQAVNQTLYRMKTKGLCACTSDQPPRWTALTGCPTCGCTGDCRAEKKAADA